MNVAQRLKRIWVHIIVVWTIAVCILLWADLSDNVEFMISVAVGFFAVSIAERLKIVTDAAKVSINKWAQR